MTDQVDPFVKKAVEELFKPTGSFYITDFDDICKALNVIPPPGHRDRLALIHCVKYRDMDQELRQEVGKLVFESLNTPGFDIQVKDQRSLAKGRVTPIRGYLEDGSD